MTARENYEEMAQVKERWLSWYLGVKCIADYK
jgi:hypothetical protein